MVFAQLGENLTYQQVAQPQRLASMWLAAPSSAAMARRLCIAAALMMPARQHLSAAASLQAARHEPSQEQQGPDVPGLGVVQDSGFLRLPAISEREFS